MIIIPAMKGMIGNGLIDPNYSSVTGLYHFDVNLADSSLASAHTGHTLAFVNTAALSSTQVKFGAKCVRCNAATDCARSVNWASTDFAPGTGDWTVEFWMWLDSLTIQFNSTKVFYDMRNNSLTNQWTPTIRSGSAGDLRLTANNLDLIIASSALSATTWLFIAASKVSGTIRLFVNGTQVGSTADANSWVDGSLSIGAAANTAGTAIGYFDEVRITPGVGRYAANFTPPTAPFPNR